METRDVLTDAFGRISELVHGIGGGLSPDELAFRPGPDANSIAWLLWHLTRIQDDHVADLAGVEQAWTADGWHDRFDLPFPASDHGYGHSSADVAAVRVASADLLTGYHDATHALTRRYLDTIDAAELDRVVDTRWDPPVTAGVRLVSVVGDTFEHAGQAAYVRGLLP